MKMVFCMFLATVAVLAFNVSYLHSSVSKEGFSGGNKYKTTKYDDDDYDEDYADYDDFDEKNASSSSSSSSSITIPKIIIQTWKDNYIPTRYEALVKSVRQKNPNYKHLFFTDNDIEKFLQQYYPQYYQTFLQLPVVIQKIDFFRYVAVYHFGGFYLDLDMQCLKSFDSLLDYQCVFPVDLHITSVMCVVPRFMQSCHNNEDIFIGQYAFGAEPKNEFIKVLIDNIHNKMKLILRMYAQLQNKRDLQFVYTTTGPDYVTKQYFAYHNKAQITVLQHERDQYFGKFAAHKAMGTWKGWV